MDHLKETEGKIFADYRSFISLLTAWKENRKTIVFTNGCFDLLHRGHVEYLAKAAGKGDRLVIGLNSDRSVERIKGKGRPLTDVWSRAVVLASLRFVDAVVVFEEDTPYGMIKMIRPDFLVKGNDYGIDEIAGSDFVLSYGGKVETIDLVAGYSTSRLIEKIKKG